MKSLDIPSEFTIHHRPFGQEEDKVCYSIHVQSNPTTTDLRKCYHISVDTRTKDIHFHDGPLEMDPILAFARINPIIEILTEADTGKYQTSFALYVVDPRNKQHSLASKLTMSRYDTRGHFNIIAGKNEKPQSYELKRSKGNEVKELNGGLLESFMGFTAKGQKFVRVASKGVAAVALTVSNEKTKVRFFDGTEKESMFAMSAVLFLVAQIEIWRRSVAMRTLVTKDHVAKRPEQREREIERQGGPLNG